MRSLLLIAAVLFGCWALITLVPVVLVLVAAAIFAGTVDPVVQWLERRGLSRMLAVGAVFAASMLVLVGIGLLLMPALADQLVVFGGNVPRLQSELAAWLGKSRMLTPAALEVKKLNVGVIPFAQVLPAAGGFVEFLGYLGSAVVLSIYLVLDRERSRAAVFALVPKRFHVRLARILAKLGPIVGGYMRGQLITSLAIFVFTFGLLTIVGVDGALALASFAALTDVIPLVGGLLATTPAVLGALSEGPWVAFGVLCAMVLYQELESRVLVPWVYGRRLRLSPAIVILALLVGGKLLGIVGALLALPVAAAMRVVAEELRVELPGDDSVRVEEAVADAKAEREYLAQSAGAPPEEAAAVAVEIADKTLKAQ